MTNAELLIDLIKDGQKLVADARKQRTTDYESRCAAWAKRVEFALQNDAVDLVRFWEAERSTNVEPGIPNTIMRDWQMTRARLVLLIEIARERQGHKVAEVVTLKPTLWGIGVDLKTAWRRWRRKR